MTPGCTGRSCAPSGAGHRGGFPHFYEGLIIWTMGGWEHEVGVQTLLLFLLGHMLLKFLAVRYLLAIPALRMAFTPRSTKARRVRRRAIELFRTAAQSRTAHLTGVLLYLSLDEHRAEIVADEAIASKVSPDVWGEAIAALIGEARHGRIAQGMALAIERGRPRPGRALPAQRRRQSQRAARSADRAVSGPSAEEERHFPEDVMWEGRFIVAKRRGRWEYVSRAAISALR